VIKALEPLWMGQGDPDQIIKSLGEMVNGRLTAK